jgi:PKD repeat protein
MPACAIAFEFMKRTLLGPLGFLLLAVPAAVQAQFTYFTNGSAITLTAYTGAGGAVAISNFVTGIGNGAFAGGVLTSVTIPNSVTSIGAEAFDSCYDLASVTLGNSVTNLGNDAFSFCSGLGSVTIGNSLASIGSDAFYACGRLTNVTIGSGVTSIGEGAFQQCDILGSATIPASVTTMSDSAFELCSGLTNVYFQGNAPSADTTVFEYDLKATAYYDIGATGWSNTFGGIPAKELLPLIVITASPTNGAVPLTVSFTSTNKDSTGHAVSNWSWNFGDGSTSTAQNPSHTYTNSGTFSVTLLETNHNGASLAGAVTSITASPLTVEFAANPVSGFVPLTVNFFSANVDSASNAITSWSWNFGDGTTSTNQNPIHTYATNGTFTPVLIATDKLGDTVAGSGPASIVAALGTVNPPDISIQTTNQTVSNAAFTVTGAASDNAAVASVYVQLNGGAWALAATTNHWSNWTAAVTLSPGTNTIAAYAVDISTNVSVTNTVSVVYVPTIGSLQVTLTPLTAVVNGAQWQVDGNAFQSSGSVVTGLLAGLHTISFKAIPNWNTPENQIITLAGGTTNTTIGVYTVTETAKPTLAITSPKSGQSVTGSNGVFTVIGTAKDKEFVTNVLYQVNGGSWTPATSTNSWRNWTASVTLSSGANTISAYAQNTSGNLSAIQKVNFKFLPGGVLVVVAPTNQNGKVTPNDNGQVLVLGASYTLTAVPGKNWLFSNWLAGGSTNFVASEPVLKFTMQSNLILQASFVTNLFLAAQGSYNGLFAPATPPREQTNSGSFTLKVTSSGSFTGDLYLGSTNPIPLSGKFGPNGSATITKDRPGGNPLTTTMTLDLAHKKVGGMVSDGSFYAQLSGDQNVFNSNYKGQYTVIIPGATNPEVGPYGISYGTVTVSADGAVTFAGSLADGTAVSRSSVVSKDGYWPFYVPLYSGQGSLWSWNYFTTNGTVISTTNASWTNASWINVSWINGTNPAKSVLYPAGFTNQETPLIGAAYEATAAPLLDLTNGVGEVLLQGGGLAATITNFITLASDNVITLTANSQNTNNLTLTITKSTGVISGAFTDDSQTIKVHGVLLQNQTGAAGYFLGPNQSGAFTLGPP